MKALSTRRIETRLESRGPAFPISGPDLNLMQNLWEIRSGEVTASSKPAMSERWERPEEERARITSEQREEISKQTSKQQKPVRE